MAFDACLSAHRTPCVEAADEVIGVLQKLPDRTYATMAEIEHEVGKTL
jgi:hypothetical protein